MSVSVGLLSEPLLQFLMDCTEASTSGVVVPDRSLLHLDPQYSYAAGHIHVLLIDWVLNHIHWPYSA